MGRNPLRILFINSIHRSKYGGGEKWMVEAARGLSEGGHSVWLASKRGSEILKAADRAGVRTRVFSIHGDFSPLATLGIRRFLKEEGIEILVCNLNKDVRVAGLAARLVGTPVVLARHGVQLCGKQWKHRMTLTHLADGIVTNTETIRRAYMDYGWFDDGFIRVVYNGVREDAGTRPFDFSVSYPGKKVVLGAGRLSGQKGFDVLIEAAALVRAEREDVAFCIAGKGRLRSELEAQVRERGLGDTVFFLGFQENLRPYLKGCDLFVLSSRFEGMPNVVMEAMAVGKAVVATDVNGVGELMVDGKTGVIVPPEDPGTLARAILSVIDDEERLASFGRQGLIRVREHFTMKRMIASLESVFYEKLAEKTG